MKEPKFIPTKIRVWKGKYKCIFFAIQPLMGTGAIKLLEPAIRIGVDGEEFDEVLAGTVLITPVKDIQRVKKPNTNIFNFFQKSMEA